MAMVPGLGRAQGQDHGLSIPAPSAEVPSLVSVLGNIFPSLQLL